MIHAELNAILNAKKDLRGWTMYCTKPPCSNCALSIIQAGIYRLVMPQLCDTSSWYPSQHAALEMMREAGLAVETLI